MAQGWTHRYSRSTSILIEVKLGGDEFWDAFVVDIKTEYRVLEMILVFQIQGPACSMISGKVCARGNSSSLFQVLDYCAHNLFKSSQCLVNLIVASLPVFLMSFHRVVI